MHRICRLGVALLVLLTSSVAFGEEKPLPVDRSVILKDPGPYIVEGTRTIPRGVEITLQQGTVIHGSGRGAELVVEGALVIRGTDARPVKIGDLTIRLGATFDSVRLDRCRMTSSPVRSAKDGASDGKLQIEACRLDARSPVELRMTKGRVAIFGSTFLSRPGIEGVPDEDGRASRLKVAVTGCVQSPTEEGLAEGLLVSGAVEVGVGRCRLAGDTVRITDCDKVLVTGCKIEALDFEIRHRDPGGLRDVTIQKCDFYGRRVALLCPKRGSSRVPVVFDRCYFHKRADERTIRSELIEDAEDSDAEETAGARAVFKKTRDRPVGLATSPR